VPGSILNSAQGLRRQEWDAAAGRFVSKDHGTGFFRPPGQPRAGTLTAMDPATNRIVWQKRTTYPMGTGSGLLATAGGLLLHGESDGNLVASTSAIGTCCGGFRPAPALTRPWPPTK
jgi:hypothetical protein